MTKRVAILAFDDMEALDFAGPFEVFTTATRVASRRGDPPPFYVASTATTGRVRARAGLVIEVDRGLEEVRDADLVLVPGGVTAEVERDDAVLSWLREASRVADVTASVCTGVFVLAAAGLLESERVTTHFEDVADLARRYPRLRVLEGRRWVDEGHFVTSAGISAGIDMSLHLVERLASRDLALATARQMDYDWRESPAPGPRSGPIVTVFRSRLRPGVEDAYREVAEQMSAAAAAMEGFVDESFYTSADGERVTIVRFADADAQLAWARHPAHLDAQRRGREEFYSSYDITVGAADHVRRFSAPLTSDQSSA